MTTLAEIRRYPIKSFRGESVASGDIQPWGLVGDRRLAFVDDATSLIASAKYPAKWRDLLQYSARTLSDGSVEVTAPDGRLVSEAELAEHVSATTGRGVRLVSTLPPAGAVERAVPEEVIDHGEQAEVEFTMLELGLARPAGGFSDFAPLHLVTTSSLAAVSAYAGHEVVAARFRPNLVIDTGSEARFVENDWLGREFSLGETRLRIELLTPRCAIPTLPQGDLPRDPSPVQVANQHNRQEVEGFGVLPCVGAYASVVEGGSVRVGDVLTFL